MEDQLQEITDSEKQYVYARLKKQLKIAMEHRFFLEAVMIEYSIVEDRMRAILDLLEIKHITKQGRDDGLSKKISNVEKEIDSQAGLAKKLDRSLLDDIRKWVEIRDRLVHRSCIISYHSEEIEQCAADGEKLLKQIDNASGRVATYVKNLKQKS